VSKNIVVCIDGTWNTATSSVAPSTNVHLLWQLAVQRNQIKFYFPGVGTRRGLLGRRLEGATGKGVFQTARDAWEQVSGNFEPEDKIFIFGFSRGAYAARHLASMIVRRGLRGWQGKLEEEFRQWRTEIKSASTTVRGEVYFLGLFDCVPANHLYVMRDRSYYLNEGTLESGIVHFRHAVSRDERRWSFRPIVFKRTDQQKSFEQLWFPGFHSDVGGGLGIASGLASFSLWWILREAFSLGLDFQDIGCSDHDRKCETLNFIWSIDPEDKPVPSDYWTTRAGLTWDRTRRELENTPGETPHIASLVDCPRCGKEMFDYFKTNGGQRWIQSVRERLAEQSGAPTLP